MRESCLSCRAAYPAYPVILRLSRSAHCPPLCSLCVSIFCVLLPLSFHYFACLQLFAMTAADSFMHFPKLRLIVMNTSKFNLSFFIILLIGFVDYLGIGLVYPIFAVLLFDTANPILPPDTSAEYRGAMLGLLIGLTPISQFFSLLSLEPFLT